MGSLAAPADRPAGTRVMFVVASLAVSGGSETQLVDLVTGLDPRFEPVLVCIKTGGELARRAASSGVEVVVLGCGSRLDPRIVPRLAALMRRVRPHIVHCTNFNATLWGRLAGIAAGVPHLVIAEHATFRTRGLERAAVPVANRLLRGRTDAVVAVGRTQAEFLAGEGNPPDRIRVIPNGVDASSYDEADDPGLRREWGVPESRPVVGIVGELRPVKDQAMLLRVAALLAGEGVDAHFVIAGDGPERAALEGMARQLGVADRVTFLGWRDDVPRVLRACHIIALTSKSEAAPLCVLEAMAAGRPVVATAVGDVPFMVEDGVTGYLVSALDDRAFAERTARLVSDAGLRASFGAAGRARLLERFTRRRMVRDYERLFDECTASGGRERVTR